MALVIPPDYYQALIPIRHDRVIRPAAITFGILAGPTRNNPVEIADDIQSAFASAFGSAMDNETTFGPTVVTFEQGDNGRGSIAGTTQTNGTAGTRDSLASNSALLLRKNSARVGRPGRGRMFIPWVLSRVDVDEVGNVATGVVTSMQTRANNLLTSLATDDLEMVILHDEGVLNADLPSLVSGLTVDPVIGTQRRRMRD